MQINRNDSGDEDLRLESVQQVLERERQRELRMEISERDQGERKKEREA